jgi:hypothetical protein
LKKLKCTNRVSNTLSFSFLFGAFSKKVMVLSTAIYHHFQHIKKDAIWFPCIESGCMISFGNLQCLKHPLTQQKVEASSAAPENPDSGYSFQATVFRVLIICSMLPGASAPELPPEPHGLPPLSSGLFSAMDSFLRNRKWAKATNCLDG